ncbi:hypothetical protein DH2020_024149 [Rehmannia glutinosa]|uniref:Endoglucanase n=1 Tax=Rehmannia glutinosa TaxID=99300 RepID=A0ABR0WAH9_REHGL
MYGRDPWGGPLEIAADSATDDDRSRNLQDYDKAALSRPLDETQQSWLLGPGEQKKKKYVDLGCIIVSRKIFVWTVGTILISSCWAFGGIHCIDSGRLPKHNNVSWRGNSCLNDGKSDSSSLFKDLTGGYYDAGDAIKFNFPQSFAMTMLSWSVIEYSAKYEAAGELNHVKDTIKWGTDYFLKTFNSTADTIDRLVAQVNTVDSLIICNGNFDYVLNPVLKLMGSWTRGYHRRAVSNDHYCWMRPEDIDYDRPVTECHSCSDLAAEMAAALASASIVFKDNKVYSQKLVHGAKTLFKFSRDQRGRYSSGNEASIFYNSTSYWDEFVWGATWLYYATGNTSYLQLATTPGGMIQLNHGAPQPLQYVVNAAFLATLFSDYMKAADTPGWYCGPHFYSTDVLREFAQTQSASIPKNKVKYNCKGGWKWRDSSKPNPNTIVGAMVAGPDRHDGFHDVRSNYNYTEPTLAGNAGLVAALVALSGDTSVGIDKNTMFSAVPPMFPTPPPPPAPWKP